MGHAHSFLPPRSLGILGLQAIAKDPIMESSLWLWGYLSSIHMDLINRLYEEPDRWGSIINLRWGTLLTDVENARDHAAESMAIHSSLESTLSPQLRFKGRIPASTLVLCRSSCCLRP